MKRNFRSSSTPSRRKAEGGRRSSIWSSGLLLTAFCLLLSGLTGCESLQKKFTRKPKHPLGRPSPIVQFQDYTKAMTPMDRYRKHYALFDYWNTELLNALSGGSGGAVLSQSTMNLKRVKRASADSLQELRALARLLDPEGAAKAALFIEERERWDAQLQQDRTSSSGLDRIRRGLEQQSTKIHRELFWRRVEDHLKTVTE